jgi:hypothetical protein
VNSVKISGYRHSKTAKVISLQGEKHLDTVGGESYIYISLFEGEARLGKVNRQLMGYPSHWL